MWISEVGWENERELCWIEKMIDIVWKINECGEKELRVGLNRSRKKEKKGVDFGLRRLFRKSCSEKCNKVMREWVGVKKKWKDRELWKKRN